MFRRYEWELTYPTATFLDVLMTYSDHRTLPEPARNGLLGCISNLIDDRYGGQIATRYLTQLGDSPYQLGPARAATPLGWAQ